MFDANKKGSRTGQMGILKKAELANLLKCYQGFVSMFLMKQVQLCQLAFVYSGNMYALCMVRPALCHHH